MVAEVQFGELQLILQLALARQQVKRAARQSATLAQAVANEPSITPKLLRRTQTWLNQPGAHLVHWFSSAYPEQLRHIHQPPMVLFMQGQIDLLSSFQVAIVGSRKATPGGLHSASYFAGQLTRHGVVVSSGLALGVDAAAHRAALAVGPTLAVLGTGIDMMYPAKHKQLQQQIYDQGLVISEFPPGWPAKSDHFPRRNRILAGLAQGVLVIEAVRNSGSLVTARFAMEQGRELFAVPHSMWESAAVGSNELLQQGAKLVLSVADILSEFPHYEAPRALVAQQMNATSENKSEEGLANSALLDNVGYEATSIDDLVVRSGLPVTSVTEQLVMLELEGHVASVPGGFIRVGRR